MIEFGIREVIAWMKTKSKESFRSIVRKKAKELAVNTLKQVKESHTKMDNLDYNDLEMQQYLKDERIKVNQARALFRFRTRMARF